MSENSIEGSETAKFKKMPWLCRLHIHKLSTWDKPYNSGGYITQMKTCLKCNKVYVKII